MSIVEGLELDRDQLRMYLESDLEVLDTPASDFGSATLSTNVVPSGAPAVKWGEAARLDRKALEQLLKKYTPLVRRIASIMVVKMPPSVEIDDLIQAGMIGLMQALERFDPDAETTFEGYAVPRIRGAMYDELRHTDEMPRTHRRIARTVMETKGKLEHQLGRAPSISEMAKSMRVSMEECGQMLSEMSYGNSVSIEDLSGGAASPDHIAAFSTTVSEPTMVLEPFQKEDVLNRAIAQLDSKQRHLIIEHFHNDRRMVDIAVELGVSGSRISQLLSKAIETLRLKVAEIECPQLRLRLAEEKLQISAAATAQLNAEREREARELELANTMRAMARRSGLRPGAWKNRDTELDTRLGPLTADMLDIVRW